MLMCKPQLDLIHITYHMHFILHQTQQVTLHQLYSSQAGTPAANMSHTRNAQPPQMHSRSNTKHWSHHLAGLVKLTRMSRPRPPNNDMGQAPGLLSTGYWCSCSEHLPAQGAADGDCGRNQAGGGQARSKAARPWGRGHGGWCGSCPHNGGRAGAWCSQACSSIGRLLVLGSVLHIWQVWCLVQY